MNENPREWSRLLMFYGHFKNGFLPDAGAITDQSNVLMEAFSVLDNANHECDKIIEEERKRAAARNKRGPTPQRKV